MGFADPQAFLAEVGKLPPGCLILDIRMPAISGLKLQERLSDQGIDIAQLLQDLGDDVPDGRLVDIEAEEGDGDGKMAIVIEVV